MGNGLIKEQCPELLCKPILKYTRARMRAHAWTRTHHDTFQWQLPWGILAPTLKNERNIQQAMNTVAQLSQHL